MTTGRSGEEAVRIGVLARPAGLAVWFAPLVRREVDEVKAPPKD